MGLFKSINMYMYKLSPYEWKILKWDYKPAQINKQTKLKLLFIQLTFS